MSTQADVVKKSNLKLKVLRSKNVSSTPAIQGPKTYKEFWFVFRSLNGGEKVLEYHQNERKFQESAAYPKGVVHLGSAVAVSYHNPEKKQHFSIELADGSLVFLEAASEPLAREWMNCLNAVLFGKGTGPDGALQYFVEVAPGSRLQHTGPCMLVVKDEHLVVKTRDGAANLVRWKLAHIRSFKAKKDILTVYSGSRSSTGVGEYYFNTDQSVQITHAIETVVKKLKEDAVGGTQQPQSTSAQGNLRQFSTEHRRPLPPPPTHRGHSPTQSMPCSSKLLPSTSEVSIVSSLAGVPDHIPSELLSEQDDPSLTHRRKYIPAYRCPEYSEVGQVANIPPAIPSEGYSVVGEAATVGYERLDHTKLSLMRKSTSPPNHDPEAYSHLNHLQQTASPHNASNSPTPPPLPPARVSPAREATGEDSPYGRLDHSTMDTGQSRKQPAGRRDGYDQLHFGTKDIGGDNEDYDTIGTASLALKRVQPPKPPPYKPKADSSHTEQQSGIYSYAQISDTAHHSTDRKDGVYTEIPPSIPKEVSKGYGRLNHGKASGTSFPQQAEGYSKLDVKLRPPSILDPYASLSDSNITELSEAIRRASECPVTSDANSVGQYSALQSVVPPPQVDDKGYSKPWTSFTVTAVSSSNKTPAPSAHGRDSRSHDNAIQNGTGTDNAVFECLYDAVADGPEVSQENRENKCLPAPLRESKNSQPLLPPRS